MHHGHQRRPPELGHFLEGQIHVAGRMGNTAVDVHVERVIAARRFGGLEPVQLAIARGARRQVRFRGVLTQRTLQPVARQRIPPRPRASTPPLPRSPAQSQARARGQRRRARRLLMVTALPTGDATRGARLEVLACAPAARPAPSESATPYPAARTTTCSARPATHRTLIVPAPASSTAPSATRRHDLDLDRLDPAVMVAQQAAPGVQFEQALARSPVLGVEPQQLQRPAASASERIPNTKVAPIRFSSDSRSPIRASVTSWVLTIGTANSDRPIRCSEASSALPTGSPSRRQPSSNENSFSAPARSRAGTSRTSRSAAPAALRHARPGCTPNASSPALALAGRGSAGR